MRQTIDDTREPHNLPHAILSTAARRTKRTPHGLQGLGLTTKEPQASLVVVKLGPCTVVCVSHEASYTGLICRLISRLNADFGKRNS